MRHADCLPTAMLAGVALKFSIASGGSSVSATTPSSDASGRATGQNWKIGAVGDQQLRVESLCGHRFWSAPTAAIRATHRQDVDSATATDRGTGVRAGKRVSYAIAFVTSYHINIFTIWRNLAQFTAIWRNLAHLTLTQAQQVRVALPGKMRPTPRARPARTCCTPPRRADEPFVRCDWSGRRSACDHDP